MDLSILHISDIHLSRGDDPNRDVNQLLSDLIYDLNVEKLDYLVISGDIANTAAPEEYEKALVLIRRLVEQLDLDHRHIIVVPGNHDVNWKISEQAYSMTDSGLQVLDQNLYRQRFANFGKYFVKQIHGNSYPLDYEEQGILHIFPQDQLLFLALNSCWEVDHFYRNRASINSDALANSLQLLEKNGYNNWLKIAVWHHSIVSRFNKMDAGFIERLLLNGFQICMNGSIHESTEGFYQDIAGQGSVIHIISAGMFGNPSTELILGLPLQYNLLRFNKKDLAVKVYTRKKEKLFDSWRPDARWMAGSGEKPTSWYTFNLKPATLPSGEKQSFSVKQLNSYQRQEFIELLLKSRVFHDNYRRRIIVENLEPGIKQSIHLNGNLKAEAYNIVSVCSDYVDGIDQLIQAIRAFENNSVWMKEVDAFIRRIGIEPRYK